MLRFYFRLVGRWRWSLMLGLVIALFLAEPILGGGPWIGFAVAVLFSLIVVGAIVAADTPPRRAGIGFAIAAVWLALQIAEKSGFDPGLLMPLLALAMLGGVLWVTFAYLIAHHENVRDALAGTVFGYFLLAMAWAVLFVQIERQNPGAFSLDPAADITEQLSYFSIVTLTTLGYGDIRPLTPIARITAAFSAASGVLYVALLVGTIVGGFRNEPTRRD